MEVRLRREMMSWIWVIVLLQLVTITTSATTYNVLLIIVDDLRTEIGSYRNSTLTNSLTPNLDAFAKTSVQFDRAYAQVALCGPSRASFLTGRTPRALDYFQHNLDDVKDDQIIYRTTVPTLPKTFQAAGYATRGAGKVFHRDENLNEFQLSKSSNSVQCPCNPDAGLCPKMTCTIPDAQSSSLEDSGVIDWGINQLTKLKGNKFFMSLGIRKPHLPYYVPEHSIQNALDIFGDDLSKLDVPNPKRREDAYSLANYYCDAIEGYLGSYENDISDTRRLRSTVSSSLREDLLEKLRMHEGDIFSNLSYFRSENDYSFDFSNLQEDHVTKISARDGTLGEPSTQLGSLPLPNDFIKQIKLGYFASVNWADELIGKVLQKLTELKIDDQTVVVIIGDNGFNLGEQGNYCKNNNFEASTQVPLYVRHPKGKVNLKRKEIVSLLDLYPTLLDLAGITSVVPITTTSLLQGKSFSNLVLTSLPEINSEVSRVSFSGIFRCYDSGTRTLFSCVDYTDVNVIGYSVRTNNFRYTEWRDFNPSAANPYDFNGDVLERQLFDHTLDLGYYPDKFENQNLYSFIAEKSAEIGVDQLYLGSLVDVMSNMLQRFFQCETADCVEITHTATPTGTPTLVTTVAPTETPTPFPTSKLRSNEPTDSPIHDGSHGGLTDSPTSSGDPSNRNARGGYNPGLSAGISVVIMLASLAIGLILFLWAREQRKKREKLEKERLKKRRTRKENREKEVTVEAVLQ